MTIISRYTVGKQAPKNPLDEEEDDGLEAAAQKKLATPKTAAPLQATAPTGTSPLPPPRTLAQAAPRPLATTPPPPQPTPTPVPPNPQDDEAKRAALEEIAKGDGRRSGFANPEQNDGGGIQVTGQGNHNDRSRTEDPTDLITGPLDPGDEVNPGANVAISDDGLAEIARRRAEQEAKRRAERDRIDGGGQGAADPHYSPDDVIRGGGSGKAPKPEPDSEKGASPDDRIRGGGDDLEALALAREQERERNATRDELAASKAKALMMANARAQLAGMGLSGSTAALEGDISRTQDRTAALTMGELGRTQRNEGREDRRLDIYETDAEANRKRADTNDAWLALQRKMALDMLEQEQGEDVDGDGDIGGSSTDLPGAAEAVGDFGDETRGGVGHKGWKPEKDGELPLPTGFDTSSARDMGIFVNPFTDEYVGSDGRYHYYNTPTGVGRMRK